MDGLEDDRSLSFLGWFPHRKGLDSHRSWNLPWELHPPGCSLTLRKKICGWFVVGVLLTDSLFLHVEANTTTNYLTICLSLVVCYQFLIFVGLCFSFVIPRCSMHVYSHLSYKCRYSKYIPYLEHIWSICVCYNNCSSKNNSKYF